VPYGLYMLNLKSRELYRLYAYFIGFTVSHRVYVRKKTPCEPVQL